MSDEYESATETMASLRLIGAGALIQIICGLAARAQAAGCDAATNEGWESFFGQHSTDADEEAAYDAAAELPARFAAWLQAHPDKVRVGELRVAAITAARPLRFARKEEIFAGLAGMAGLLMKPLMRSMTKSMDKLAGMPGMEDIELDSLATGGLCGIAQDRAAPFKAQARKDLIDQYGSLAGVIAGVPLEDCLEAAAEAGSGPAGTPPQAVPEAARMAIALRDFGCLCSAMGLDSWLETSPAEEIDALLRHAEAIGSPISTGLRPLWSAACISGADAQPGFDWDDFLDGHQSLVPSERQMEQWLTGLPALYRSYWESRPVEEPVPAAI